MKKITILTYQVEDVPDIAPPQGGVGFGLAGAVSASAEAFFVQSVGIDPAVAMFPMSEFVRVAREADPRIDLTHEGRKAAYEKWKAAGAKAARPNGRFVPGSRPAANPSAVTAQQRVEALKERARAAAAAAK